MTKVKIISHNNNFFNLDWSKLGLIVLYGLLSGLFSHIIRLIFNFGLTNPTSSYQLSLVFTGLLIAILSLSKIERPSLIILPTIILLWYSVEIATLLGAFFCILTAFWFAFFGWISQIYNIKLCSAIIIISLILLMIFM